MVNVRSRKFCCCFPVRFGVFVLSMFAMIGGSFVAAIGWIQVSQLNENPLPVSDQIALYIHSGIFTVLALLAVFGFFGALVRNRSLTSAFAIALAVHLGFSVASGIFTLVTLFKQDPQVTLAKCLNGVSVADAGEAKVEVCKSEVAIFKGVMVAAYVITWLIQLYAYIIVERYVDQLDEEADAANPVVIPRSTVVEITNPQVTTYNGFQSSYPFSTPHQAYGVTRGQDPATNMV
ncbi:unnamed protein product [Cyclocybe aegerita]|uniref:Tetraspanin n=1 Tax=Cyclocybe aegerita TaxID=1973307 RepID=A0A8S0W4V1_CYCAE|nr:unnamed protein product [Cyclocybe aegerita]